MTATFNHMSIFFLYNYYAVTSRLNARLKLRSDHVSLILRFYNIVGCDLFGCNFLPLRHYANLAGNAVFLDTHQALLPVYTN